jgi:hypothetical protein
MIFSKIDHALKIGAIYLIDHFDYMRELLDYFTGVVDQLRVFTYFFFAIQPLSENPLAFYFFAI